MNKIKLLVMDVDGTLTDGKIYITENGEFMKAFNVKDGYGIKHILPSLGITSAIITGRQSEIVQKRCEELEINYVFQNISDKKRKLFELCKILNIDISEVAYIGDDLNDLECIKIVGLSSCPNDAVDSIKKEVNYVCSNNASNGAVREFIDYLTINYN